MTLHYRPGLAFEPGRDCPLCPRLVDFRLALRARHPDWHNAPVAGFGPHDGSLLVVGLAPGLNGANRTGRPFTGDYAGTLLYETLIRFGFAKGTFRADPDDGLQLIDCRLVNAVRCLPPENKPTGPEIRTCNGFLAAEIERMPKLRAIVALGRIAHDAVLAALSRKAASARFGHGAAHALGTVDLFDSYHCSRYNTNTRRLTEAMFHDVFAAVCRRLDRPLPA